MSNRYIHVIYRYILYEYMNSHKRGGGTRPGKNGMAVSRVEQMDDETAETKEESWVY